MARRGKPAFYEPMAYEDHPYVKTKVTIRCGQGARVSAVIVSLLAAIFIVGASFNGPVIQASQASSSTIVCFAPPLVSGKNVNVDINRLDKSLTDALSVKVYYLAPTGWELFKEMNSDTPEPNRLVLQDTYYKTMFKAPVHGSYTISVEAEGLEIGNATVLLKKNVNQPIRFGVYFDVAVSAHVRASQGGTAVDICEFLCGNGFTWQQAANVMIRIGSYNASEIAEGLAAVYASTPEDVARALQTCPSFEDSDIVEAMRSVFGLGFLESARVLVVIGVPAEDVLEPLAAIYHFSAAKAAGLLHELGVSDDTVAEKLRDSYYLKAREAAEAFIQLREWSAESIMLALSHAYPLQPEQLAEVMLTAGIATKWVARGLNATYGLPPAEIISCLRICGVSYPDVGVALEQGLDLRSREIVRAFANSGAEHAVAATALREGLGMDVHGVVDAMLAAEVPYKEIALAVVDAFDLNGDKMKDILVQLGVDEGAALEAVKVGREGVILPKGGVVKNLFQEGKNASVIVAVCVADYPELTRAYLGACLWKAGASVVDVLTSLHESGATDEEIVTTLGLYGADQIAYAFNVSLGYSPEQIFNLFYGMGWRVQSATWAVSKGLNLIVDATTEMLLAAGMTPANVALGLSEGIRIQDAEVAYQMHSHGIDPKDIAKALKDLGWEYPVIASALLNAPLAPEIVASALAVGLPLAEYLVATCLALAGLAAAVVVGVVVLALGTTLAVVASGLFLAGLALAAVGMALAGAVGLIVLSFEVAGALMACAGAVAITVSSVALTIGAVFGITPDMVGYAMAICGYVLPEEIAKLLKDTYNWAAKEVTEFCKDTLEWAQETIEKALDWAGYAIEEIKEAIEGFFGEVSDWFKDKFSWLWDWW